MSDFISEYMLYGLAGGITVNEIQESRVLPWVAAKGDAKRRYDYKLNRNSIVYDVGGYLGHWAKDIVELYDCYVEIFEPIQKYSSLLTSMFEGNPKVNVHPFGLGGRTEKIKISLENEASSTFKTSGETELVSIKNINSWLRHDRIDLMKLNIEGAEFGLLNNLINSGNITKIDNLQIQFHDFAPNAKSERIKLQKKLSKTHKMTYNYPFVWENWTILK